ncbi:MAG: hypothetical protein OEZ59_11545 [Deltaproteobacteria bacterium]|nr:hypothetical protein [Deltaproteobacteria bacterium]
MENSGINPGRKVLAALTRGLLVFFVLLLALGACSIDEEVVPPLEEPPVEKAEDPVTSNGKEQPPAPSAGENTPAESKEQAGGAPPGDQPVTAPPAGTPETASADPTVPSPIDTPGLAGPAAAGQTQTMADDEPKGISARRAFGKIPQPPEPGAPETAPRGSIPYEQAFPPPGPPGVVRVGVISHVNQKKQGQKVALLVGDIQRDYLEKNIGKMIKLAFVSSTEEPIPGKGRVSFRPQDLGAAVRIASVLVQPQVVEPMTSREREIEGVDILVYVGRDIK